MWCCRRDRFALLCLLAVMLLAPGCGRSRTAQNAAATKPNSPPKQGAKEPESRVADVTSENSTFTAKDAAGRPLVTLRVTKMDAAYSPGSGIEGAVALQGVRGTLYREGQPSLWVEAPEAAWEAGILRASKGVRSGTVDGRLTCAGERAEWTARADRLQLDRARCQAREQRTALAQKDKTAYDLDAEGPAAVWEAGQLTMAEGFMARTTDGAGTLKAAMLTWRAADARLVASGNVQASRNGSRLQAQTLKGDTRLRRVAATGAPVASASGSRPSARSSAPAAGRASFTFGQWRIEYDSFNADLAADPIPFEATGRVVLTGPDGTITAPRVEGQATQKLELIVARARGGVSMKTPEQAGRAVVAQGREAVYEPAKGQVRLSGEACATVTSPALAAPARLSGGEVALAIPSRSATVTAAQGGRVELEAQPKAQPERLQLTAERMRYDGPTDRVTAEGRPSIRDPRGTLTADRMEINLAGEANNIMVARAVGNVVVDARLTEPRPQTFAATGREGTYIRAENRISLRGDVKGSVTRPDMPKPATFDGEELTYDMASGRFQMSGQPARAQVVPPPRK
jgi:lipopolysaccharide transport protein LptA